jgi:hypothetical protein
MADETEKTYRLIKPLEVEGKTITELNLREPTAGELEFSEKKADSNNGASIQLIAAVSGLHPNVVKGLCARDYKAAAGYLTSFLEISPATGKNA